MPCTRKKDCTNSLFSCVCGASGAMLLQSTQKQEWREKTFELKEIHFSNKTKWTITETALTKLTK